MINIPYFVQMKDFFTAFLERFKHPILYSIITALVVHNFDQIYYLSISPFHYADMKPYNVMSNFITLIETQGCERIWIPIILGGLFGTFIPTLIDVGYSTLIALAMSWKEIGVNWGERLSWTYKINDARNKSYSLAEGWEEVRFWSNAGLFTLETRALLFKTSPYIEVNRVVIYNEKKNQIEYPSISNDNILGFVYKLFPNNLALVVLGGVISDISLANYYAGPEVGDKSLTITNEGKLEVMKNPNDIPGGIYAVIQTRESQKGKIDRKFILMKPNNTHNAASLTLQKRLYGID